MFRNYRVALLVSVRYTGPQAAAKGDDDNTTARIAKYIPGEVLAFFAMWTQGVALLPWKVSFLHFEVAGAIVGVIITPVYFTKFFPNTPEEARAAHRWISTVAFAVYAYTISAAVIPKHYVPALALLATALITLVSAIFIPTSKN
jgi:hypothetical protein